jgi:hypothetical protein
MAAAAAAATLLAIKGNEVLDSLVAGMENTGDYWPYPY